MADDKKAAKGGSNLMGTLVTLAIVIIVPAVLAGVAVKFVVMPLVASPADTSQEEEAKKAEEEKKKEETSLEGAVAYDFKEAQASVIPDTPDSAAPLLLYQVSMACNHAGTAELIKSKESWFISMLAKLHRNHTRAELNDPYVEDTILRQAKQEANDLLKRCGSVPEGGGGEGGHGGGGAAVPEDAGPPEVLEVMHIKFAVVDL